MNSPTYIARHGRQIEVVRLGAPAPALIRPLSHIKFVQIPARWIEKLGGESGRTYDLALLLLQLNFKNRGRPVNLSNGVTRHLKLDRTVKYRALARLEQLGLVSIVHKQGAAPLVNLML
jgi:hypothetical protein